MLVAGLAALLSAAGCAPAPPTRASAPAASTALDASSDSGPSPTASPRSTTTSTGSDGEPDGAGADGAGADGAGADGASDRAGSFGSGRSSGGDRQDAPDGGLGSQAMTGAFDPLRLLGNRESIGPVRFGMAIPPDEGAALEAEAGARLGIIRVFARWDTPFPSPAHEALLAEGRHLHLSIRPRTDDGRSIGWAELASAQPGSELYRALDDWLRTVATYGSQIYLTLNHEPETRASDGHGTPEDYRAAWRHMVGRLRANGGGSVRTVLVLGRGAYADGSIDQWYPGDDVVDVIGVDAYNWSACQGGRTRPWMTPAELLAPAVEFAAARDKPLAVPEIASTEHPSDPLAKARWIIELARTLATSPVADRLVYAAWFDPHDRAWPDCAWAHDSSVASRQAMIAAVAWLNAPG